MAKRVVELLKDLLIFILVIAITVLTLMALPTKTLTDSPVLSAVLKPVAQYFGISRAELAVRQDRTAGTASAQPLAVSVNNPGGRCSYQYDFAALDLSYETLGSALAQALASCEAPAESSREALYRALSGASVYFRYPGALPCAVLADWLGIETAAAGCDAKAFALCIEDESVFLYLVADAVQRCKTDLAPASLRELCGSAPADGSFFAFESDEAVYQNVDGLSLLEPEAPSVRKITSQTPTDTRFLTALAADLGFNPYAGSGYRDQNGTMHYTESSAGLVVTSEGVLTLENSDPSRLGGYAEDASSRIYAAATLLWSMLGGSESEARLYLCDYTENDDTALCRFYFVIGGIAILPADELISVEFTDRYISAVHAVLRTYFETADTLAVLPPKQAASISAADRELRIFYAETGQSVLSAGWAK